MKQIILGTAGHIDHGKTSLIRALTGTETDRLKEEKERGITIELGFASLDLPGGQHLGIVDVPGHEKFVKNMVAGATGIDIVAMVIAADEGVMPQTREHMEICTLLGVKHGLVVMTKIDMVDEEWLELAIDDIQGFMQGTFLEDAPIIPVSSVTGEGIPDFVKALDDISRVIPERSPSSLFRLPVDRVFTMKGFGTVITGTLVSGTVKVGRKAEWPRWVPPAEMRKRQPDLPESVEGGPNNPLGARALYLFNDGRDTLYRIHGSNEPWTIGQAVSSGCIRMRNEDVTELYSRVDVGTRVIVM